MYDDKRNPLVCSMYDSMAKHAQTEHHRKVWKAAKAVHYVLDATRLIQEKLFRFESDAVDDETLDACEQFFTCVGELIDTFMLHKSLKEGGYTDGQATPKAETDDGSIGH